MWYVAASYALCFERSFAAGTVFQQQSTSHKPTPQPSTCFGQGKAAGGKLFAVMGRVPDIDPQAGGETLNEVTGALELVDIGFAYPAHPETPIFEGFSLSVPAGKTTALVGSSGRCGIVPG